MTRLRGPDLERVDLRVSDLEDAPLAGGRLVQVTLAAGTTRVRHGLKRARGRVIVRLEPYVDVSDVTDADPATWVLNSTGAATALVYFF